MLQEDVQPGLSAFRIAYNASRLLLLTAALCLMLVATEGRPRAIFASALTFQVALLVPPIRRSMKYVLTDTIYIPALSTRRSSMRRAGRPKPGLVQAPTSDTEFEGFAAQRLMAAWG